MRFPSIALLCALLSLTAYGQKEATPAQEPRPPVPVEQWLAKPDRADFKWKVEILSPRLTYQQRYLVQVRAYVDVAPLLDSGPRDLYFLLKIADDKGQWLPDDTHNHYPLPPGLDKQNELQYTAGFYARPGRYTAAVVFYDAVKGQGNLWRKQFEVKAPSKNVLPELDRDLPVVEFIDEVPNDALPTHQTVRLPRRIRVAPLTMIRSDSSDPEWPPGHGVEWLPVHNPRPLRVDLVFNFAPWLDPYLQVRTTATATRADVGRMLQVASLLSHLKLDRGCLRLSAVDLSQLSVIFDRLDGAVADWDKLTAQVRKLDHNTISADVLGNRKSTAGFLRDYMTNLMVDASGCGAGNEKVERVVVLVSHDFAFPSGTHGDRLWPDVQCACRFYHLRINSGGPGSDDDLERFLKPAKPRRFDVRSPEQMRRALAELITELSGGAARAKEVGQERDR